MKHGISQSELADLIGYEQTYISALEVGKKGPPTQEFVEKLITALKISGEEREQLLEAADASCRKLIIDNDMPQDVYWLLSDFKKHLHDLSSVQIQLLRQILAIKESIHKEPRLQVNRIKRRKKAEVIM
jgi:transcriptional regulator with XRE-family HTH domain